MFNISDPEMIARDYSNMHTLLLVIFNLKI